MNQKFSLTISQPKFFMVAKSLSWFEPKFIVKNFGPKFLWLLNHFLGNGFKTKFFIRNFSAENLRVCKIISWEICLKKNCIRNFSAEKI
jgi:hypothetical protein